MDIPFLPKMSDTPDIVHKNIQNMIRYKRSLHDQNYASTALEVVDQSLGFWWPVDFWCINAIRPTAGEVSIKWLSYVLSVFRVSGFGFRVS